MTRINRCAFLIATIVGTIAAGRLVAEGDCCVRCGCHAPCHKVCRLVEEEKKVEVICYGAKKQDFCVPGPSKPGCPHKEEVCATCGDDNAKDIVAKPHWFAWREWIPGCAKVRTKTLLMKKVETKKIPSHKWVVEDLCEACQAEVETKSPSASEEKPKTETK